MGRPRSELIGLRQHQIHPPEQVEIYKKFFAQDHEEAIPTPKTGYIVTLSGKKVPVEILAHVFKKDGKIFQLGLFRDITSRIQAETALRESEVKFRSVVEQSYDGMLLADEQGKIFEWNQALEQITGLNRKIILNKSIWEVQYSLLPESVKVLTNKERIAADFQQFLNSGRERMEGIFTIAKSQKEGFIPRILHQIAFPIHVNKKKFLCAIIRDISKEKQVEDALKDSEEKYRTLFENTNVGIGITDSVGIFVEVNQAAADILGYTVPELMYMKSTDVYAEPNDRETIRNLVVNQKQVANYPVLFKKKNGAPFWVSVNVRLIRYKEQMFFLTTVIDIDERKRASDATKQALADALELSRVKTNLVTFASHELKTPLVPIIGWADLILTSLNKGRKIEEIIGREEITSIVNSAHRLEQIIDEFLDLGRLEENKLVVEKEPVSVLKLLVNAIKTVELLAHASRNPIHCEVQDIILNVDAFRIEQVFINILSNAIKYSPPEKAIRITSTRLGPFYKIIFIDQGSGFTPEELKGIWRPFANLATRQKEGLLAGTGIGLYLSKGIVELHEGTIDIFSEGPDKGSRVEISLPLNS